MALAKLRLELLSRSEVFSLEAARAARAASAAAAVAAAEQEALLGALNSLRSLLGNATGATGPILAELTLQTPLGTLKLAAMSVESLERGGTARVRGDGEKEVVVEVGLQNLIQATQNEAFEALKRH